MQVQSNEENNKVTNNYDLMDLNIDAINKVKNDNRNVDQVNSDLTNKSDLLNKPKELIDFDVLSHFKENISRTDKNDPDKITPNSYYCINCKHSNCPFYDEEKHLTKKRINYLLYDTHFFDEIDSKINEGLNYSKFKEDVKNNINNFIDKMKEELDKLRDIKFNEIDNFFEENDKKLIKLKKEYVEARKNIEEYYDINKKFFHIQINEDKDEDESNIKNILKNQKNNYYIEDLEKSSPNRDIENATFLLNFELMNLCDTKNLENLNFIKNIKNRIESFNEIIQTEIIEDANIISKFRRR